MYDENEEFDLCRNQTGPLRLHVLYRWPQTEIASCYDCDSRAMTRSERVWLCYMIFPMRSRFRKASSSCCVHEKRNSLQTPCLVKRLTFPPGWCGGNRDTVRRWPSARWQRDRL